MADKNPTLGARVFENDQRDFKDAAKSSAGTEAELFNQLMKLYRANAGAGVPETIPDDVLNLNMALKRVSQIVIGMRASFATQLDESKISSKKMYEKLSKEKEELLLKNSELNKIIENNKNKIKEVEHLEVEVSSLLSGHRVIEDLNKKMAKEIKNHTEAVSELEKLKIEFAKCQADTAQLKERLKECKEEKDVLLRKLK